MYRLFMQISNNQNKPFIGWFTDRQNTSSALISEGFKSSSDVSRLWRSKKIGIVSDGGAMEKGI